MNALKNEDFWKLGPLARMRHAINELDRLSLDIAAASLATDKTENAFEVVAPESDLARWRISQKLVSARSTANIERVQREAARRRARALAASKAANAENDAPAQTKPEGQ